MNKPKEVSVLGTNYKIEFRNTEDDPELKQNTAYIDSSIKKIIISNPPDDVHTKENKEAVQNQLIRHELVHAFLYESGLDIGWAADESIVDYFALQLTKIHQAYDEVKLG